MEWTIVMLDKVLAALSMLLLIGFVSIVIVFLRKPDITIVVIVVVGIAIYSIANSLRDDDAKSGDKQGGKSEGGSGSNDAPSS